MNIDKLVRSYLDAEGARVDALAMLANVHSRLDGPVAPRGGRDRAWSWRLSAAAAVILVGLFGVARNPARASPDRLIREATAAHARPVDRAYRLRVEPAPELAEKFPSLGRVREARVWTRGDRYLIEDGRVTWGCTVDGRVWAAPSRRLGLLVDPSRLPPPLAREIERALRVRSLQLEALLRELPRGFAVTEEAASPSGDRRLRAAPKSGTTHPHLSAVELEIEPATHLVRRLTLHHHLRGRPLARVTFALEETRQRPDSTYELAAHIDADAEIVGPDRPAALLAAFGQALRRE